MNHPMFYKELIRALLLSSAFKVSKVSPSSNTWHTPSKVSWVELCNNLRKFDEANAIPLFLYRFKSSNAAAAFLAKYPVLSVAKLEICIK